MILTAGGWSQKKFSSFFGNIIILTQRPWLTRDTRNLPQGFAVPLFANVQKSVRSEHFYDPKSVQFVQKMERKIISRLDAWKADPRR
jgi:hypothetical protein